MPPSSNNDTIAAIATASGEAAIAVVRLSGPDAPAIADRIFVCAPPKPSLRAPRTFVFGHVGSGQSARRDGGGRIDEAILLIFRAPHSFTRQDVMEFQCHGGEIAARRIYRALLEEGARPAEPGEFTRRAFLNGRIDLIRAEAVIDVIRAQTIRAAQAAADQLDGHLSGDITVIYDNIMRVLTEVEVRLDFDEDEVPPLTEDRWRPFIDLAGRKVTALLNTWEQGRLLRQGAMIVIAGASNVGKSTLLNALLGKERAIVSHHPGTTRDSIEEGWQLNGVPLRLVDTAGYRATDCCIEVEGISRTERLRCNADGVIYLVDASMPRQKIDTDNLAGANPERTLVICNKTDLGIRIQADAFPGFRKIFVSIKALPDEGSTEIRKALQDMLRGSIAMETGSLIGERHRRMLQKTGQALVEAAGLLTGGDSGHVAAVIVLREALAALDECLGRSFSERLLDEVFSRFCIGK